MFLFRTFWLIHLGLDRLFLTSLTCCPVCMCRYFQLHITILDRQNYYCVESVCFSCLYSSCLHWQVYYTRTDSKRHTKWPFQSENLTGECDGWFMSESDWKWKHLVGKINFVFCLVIDTLSYDSEIYKTGYSPFYHKTSFGCCVISICPFLTLHQITLCNSEVFKN